MTSSAPNTGELYEKDASERLYDDRYERGGYMDDWPDAKKRRIRAMLDEVRSEHDLPANGNALDFGCGTGALTEILAQALPEWSVWGSDLSAVAVREARERRTGCQFFAPEETQQDKEVPERFDFLFTHHVLEHVYDLEEVAEQIAQRLAPGARMLHILPCGNPGSFEHRIAQLVEGGIDPKLGNRFFFEEPGHVRRLRTEEVEKLFAKHGFRLVHAAYAHQHDGAIEWITDAPRDFQERLLDPSRAKDEASRRELEKLQRQLSRIAAWRRTRKRFASWKKRGGVRALVALAAAPLGMIARNVDRGVRQRAEEEWERRRSEASGSEMFLYFASDPSS